MEPLGAVVIATAILGALVLGVRGVVAGRRRAADQFHLAQAGRLVTARVAAVEPMDRSVNRAAGHAVTLSLPTGGGYDRTIRDTSGLGGYVVREGGQVQLRVSPDDPDLYQVEQILGPAGPYPVRAGPAQTSPFGPYLLLIAPVLAAAGLLASWQWGAQILPVLLPVLFLIVGGVLLGSGVRSGRRRRQWTAETTGVVTDVWTERQRSGRGSSLVYAFTVHFFTPDGREVHRRHRDANSVFRPKPQQQVTVRYHPAHPAEFGLAGAGGALNDVMFTIIGAVFVGIAFCTLAVFAGVATSW
ncbi:DUF3592 domain-containing protein [Natronosporangium hydrolyticum]|uniref:DUF3592 domain-containing protein n=1 Tax=Natronosporangium hydrolyticum TaxID=2811111 RepID=A0A895YIN5_9ACTN|nr:DUF3592 domain-containing protein [Natronosporangium hydrolyticum]QSB14446.1 DUF3592 domain-containing protein [Natronosporangium hydrolyticum]